MGSEKKVGAKKSSIRKMLEELDLIGELDGQTTIKDIAEKYCTSRTIAGKVLSEQLNKKKRYKRAEGSDGYEERLLNSNSLGEWKKSVERETLKDYKENVLNIRE